jgi:hypothetical protein
VNWIVADIVRIADGMLAEHWDVIQDEATQEQSKSGLPMRKSTSSSLAGDSSLWTARPLTWKKARSCA